MRAACVPPLSHSGCWLTRLPPLPIRSGRAKSRRKAAAKAKSSGGAEEEADEAKTEQDEEAVPTPAEIPTLRAFLLLLSLLTQDLNTALGGMPFDVGGQPVNGAEGAIAWLQEEYELLFLLFRELRAFTHREGTPVRCERCGMQELGGGVQGRGRGGARVRLLQPRMLTRGCASSSQNATALRDRLHVLYVLLRLCPLVRVGMEMVDHLWEGLRVSSVGRECFYQWLRRAGAGVTRADDDVLQVRETCTVATRHVRQN